MNTYSASGFEKTFNRTRPSANNSETFENTSIVFARKLSLSRKYQTTSGPYEKMPWGRAREHRNRETCDM